MTGLRQRLAARIQMLKYRANKNMEIQFNITTLTDKFY
jgi:outer membrane receptor for monomeric catechols